MKRSNEIRDTVIADIQPTKYGRRIRVFWFAGVFTFIVVVLIVIAGWHIVITIAPYVIGLLTLIALLFVGFFVYEMFQHLKTRNVQHDAERRILKAEAEKAEAEARKADIFTFKQSESVLQLRDGLNVLALPTSNVLQLSGDNGPEKFDFFELMCRTEAAYAVFGPQRSGKSWLTHHIVSYWQTHERVRPIVVGLKFDADEYTTGVVRYGPDEASINEAFNIIQAEAIERQRLANGGQPFNQMTPAILILEDATSLSAIVQSNVLESFNRQLLTTYAARNIVCYFVVHSMDLSAFGMKVGAALKDQLTCLYLIKPNEFASPSETIVRGSMTYTRDDNERRPVKGIPRIAAVLTDDCECPLYSEAIEGRVSIVPTKEERQILRLYGAGDSRTTIAAKMFGHGNTYNISKVDDILQKFGVEVIDGRRRDGQ